MNTKLRLFVSGLTLSCALTALAVAGQYDDLVKWAEGEKASARQFLADLSRASGPHDVALAVKARGQREHNSTGSLIEIVHRHPELRYVPELGLDNDAFRRWSQKHPEARARRAAVPKEAFAITQEMHIYLAGLLKSSLFARAIPRLSQYLKDPEVAASKKEHQSALKVEGRRMTELFQ